MRNSYEIHFLNTSILRSESIYLFHYMKCTLFFIRLDIDSDSISKISYIVIKRYLISDKKFQFRKQKQVWKNSAIQFTLAHTKFERWYEKVRNSNYECFFFLFRLFIWFSFTKTSYLPNFHTQTLVVVHKFNRDISKIKTILSNGS